MEKKILWYRHEAKKWIEALPLGNGRIGAMVYGGALSETIQIDESSFWSGESSDENNRPGTKELVAKIREALLVNEYDLADNLGHELVGNKNNYGTNMPVGNLTLKMTKLVSADESKEKDKSLETADYKRSLNLAEGISRVEFRYKNAAFVRECFISNPAQVGVVSLASDMGKAFKLQIRYDGIDNNICIEQREGDDFLIRGNAFESLHSDGKTGVTLFGRIRLVTDGVKDFEEGTITLTDATYMQLYIALQSTMICEEPDRLCLEQLDKAERTGYESLRREHIEDFGKLYHRMEIELGMEDQSQVPTDERIKAFNNGVKDPELMALMFQYGRYLLIASSRKDSTLPTHMGGIWNDNIYNRIDCTQDMHIDMNIQMQYWLAGVCNLPESYHPLFNWLRNIVVPSGEKTAREAYGTGGWTAHVVSNPWGFTSLGWSYNWGVWQFGGIWASTLLWDYYRYTGDLTFLKEFAYPIIKEAARFASEFIFKDESSGYYMTGPSYSPENQFSHDGKDYFLALSNTCDVILVREIFEILEKVSAEIGLGDDEFMKAVQDKREKLPPYQIGKKGQLQEWFHDFEEPIPNHRHTSHLLGLYPFSQITPEKTPEMAAAAKKTIELRYENFEITSWGMVMLISYYARLKDGENAMLLLGDTFKRLVKTNMASVMSDETSMWCGTWELDGNTGLTAAICEMLVQSHDGCIQILPALPKEWQAGKVRGICLRGGHEAEISWENGRLAELKISGRTAEHLILSYGKQLAEIDLEEGESLYFNEQLNRISVNKK